MVRPRKKRCIQTLPIATFYKPRGIALHDLKGISLSLEELEAIRLVDGEGLKRDNVAEMMDVSLPTLCRILANARKTVARALANGWALRIEGGNFRVRKTSTHCGHGRNHHGHGS